MKIRMQTCIARLLVLLLSLSMLVACGGGNDEAETVAPTDGSPEKVKIIIGNLTDITGPAANALEKNNDWAIL